MYSVGLDVDKFVFTEKSCYILETPVYSCFYVRKNLLSAVMPGQSVGNFTFSTKATADTKNTYNNYTNLPLISERVNKRKSNLTHNDFGYFLAGLIEGDG